MEHELLLAVHVDLTEYVDLNMFLYFWTDTIGELWLDFVIPTCFPYTSAAIGH